MTIASEFIRKRPLSFERVSQIRRDREARGLLTPEPPPPCKTPWQLLKQADDAIARRKREESAAAIEQIKQEEANDHVSFLKRKILDMRIAVRVAFPQERDKSKQPKIIDIQNAVADEFGVSRADIIGSSRMVYIVRPRQVAMWIAREMTKCSFPEIGRRCGGRDHSTALHGVTKIAKLRESDAELRARIDAIMERVRV